jgi:hypothetical protein
VELTLGGVMTVLRRGAAWEEAKKQLGDAGFMGRLLNYDKDGLDDALLKKLAKITANPEFTPDAVGKVSLAARGMCMWVRAMEVYGSVAREVGPKRARLKAAQDNLARKQAALAAAQEALTAVLAKVASLRCGRPAVGGRAGGRAGRCARPKPAACSAGALSQPRPALLAARRARTPPSPPPTYPHHRPTPHPAAPAGSATRRACPARPRWRQSWRTSPASWRAPRSW